MTKLMIPIAPGRVAGSAPRAAPASQIVGMASAMPSRGGLGGHRSLTDRALASRLLARIGSAPEVVIACSYLGLTLIVATALGFPLSLPSGERAAFVGIHYLYPLVGIGLCGGVMLALRRDVMPMAFLVALPAYALVLLCHFNLKLWIAHINPSLWDDYYWTIDQALRPLVDGSFILRKAIAPIVPLDSNFYMTAFIMLFYLSFCIHAVRDRHEFRTLVIAALLFQGAGALAYLVMPALGPFVFEPGVEPGADLAQQSMLNSYHANRAGGAEWIASNGGAQLTVGLAAMPSLHTGGAFLFLLFAWRSARVLLPVYVPLFAFIALDAVATRWHYLIDLPVGMLLALGCVWMATRINSTRLACAAPRHASAEPGV